MGGTSTGVVGLGGNEIFGSIGRAVTDVLPTVFGAGIILPSASLQAFQSKGNTKLIASTQIHAFNNEDSSARIGQRVPVRSASFQTGLNNGGNGGNGVVSDVINYEQVGLTLKFKPIVFPNQDVQVAMEIESKDVAGAQSLTPTFTERTIKGTARVQNNKTLLLASVAQNTESNTRAGLPLLGLIPILGRLFTAPNRDNRQVDIVIAVTPRVIRAPAILPEDEIERPTGSLAVPTNSSLEAMVVQDEIEEQLAAIRRLPTVAKVQLPDQKLEDAPVYVKSNAPQAVSQNVETTEVANTTPSVTSGGLNLSSLRPIDTSVKTLQIGNTSDTSEEGNSTIALKETSLQSNETISTENVTLPNAEIKMLNGLAEMKTGEKTKIAVMIKSGTAFRSAVLGLKYDPSKLAVRAVGFGDVFGADLAYTGANPYINQNGKTFVSLSSPKDTAQSPSGILAYIEIEALSAGKHEIAFDKEVMTVLTADGKNFAVKF